MSNQTFLTDRTWLRLSATLLLAGVLVSFLAGTLHPAHADPNDHVASFTEYANDSDWTAVHLGQFLGMTLLVAGLLVLYFELDLSTAGRGWTARFGFLAAALSLGLYGVLQAVDGIALKQSVDAWASAPEAEKAIRFANAEAIRWLEWAVRSYQSFVLGLAFLLFGAALVQSNKLPRMIGCLVAISGLAYLAQGWILGVEGFSATNGIPTLLGILTIIVWSLWLLVIAWRAKETSLRPQPKLVQN
jgi:hypothetical protein